MQKRLLLLSHLADDASFLAEIAAITQSQLELAAEGADAAQKMAQQDYLAIFVDVSNMHQLREFEFEIQKRFGLFSERVQPNRIHLMSSLDLSKNRETILSPLFGNFFQRPESEPTAAAQFYARFLIASETQQMPTLESLLSLPQQNSKWVQQVELKNTDQKQEAVEAVRQYLIAAKLPARVSNLISNSVDELLMNAMFDAPCDEFGKPLYSATRRDQSRELQGREQVTLRIGFDGYYFGISVMDGFGSLDRGRLLKHISESYREKDYMERLGQAGAGLGVANIFNSGGSLIYHCEPHQRTQATVLYKAYSSYRDFKNQFKFLSTKFFFPTQK